MKKGLFVFSVILIMVTVGLIELNQQASITPPPHVTEAGNNNANEDIHTFIHNSETDPYRQTVLVEYAQALTQFTNTPASDAKALAKNMAHLQGWLMCAKSFQPSIHRVKAILLNTFQRSDQYDEVLQAFTNGPYAYRILNRHCPIAKDGTKATPPTSGYTVEDEMRAAEAGLPAGMYLKKNTVYDRNNMLNHNKD